MQFMCFDVILSHTDTCWRDVYLVISHKSWNPSTTCYYMHVVGWFPPTSSFPTTRPDALDSAHEHLHTYFQHWSLTLLIYKLVKSQELIRVYLYRVLFCIHYLQQMLYTVTPMHFFSCRIVFVCFFIDYAQHIQTDIHL